MKPKTVSIEQRIEQYEATLALIETWKQQPDEVQIREHDYILGLSKKARSIRNYIVHKKDPAGDAFKYAA